jgi:hypothetical protein
MKAKTASRTAQYICFGPLKVAGIRTTAYSMILLLRFFSTSQVLKTLRENEEQWTYGIHSDKLPEFLKQFHFRLMKDRSAVEYRNTYMVERGNLLKGYEFYRVALAIRK